MWNAWGKTTHSWWVSTVLYITTANGRVLINSFSSWDRPLNSLKLHLSLCEGFSRSVAPGGLGHEAHIARAWYPVLRKSISSRRRTVKQTLIVCEDSLLVRLTHLLLSLARLHVDSLVVPSLLCATRPPSCAAVCSKHLRCPHPIELVLQWGHLQSKLYELSSVIAQAILCQDCYHHRCFFSLKTATTTE